MALWHYSDLTALFQHWGTVGFAALRWNKLSHKMKPEEPVLRRRYRCCAPAPRLLLKGPMSHGCGHIHGICRGTGGTAKAVRSRSSNSASGVTLLGEDIKDHHKAGSCNGSKPPAAAAWCCVGTVLGWYWASGARSGACWDRQREKLSKQPETEQRREQRALISGCKHKGWKGPKEERNKE